MENKRDGLVGIVKKLHEGLREHPNDFLQQDTTQLNIGLIALKHYGDGMPTPQIMGYDDLIESLTSRILEACLQQNGQKDGLFVQFIGLDASGKATIRERVIQDIKDRGGPRVAYIDLSGYLMSRKERSQREISPYHKDAFDAMQAGSDIETLLTKGSVQSPIYKEGKTAGNVNVEGNLIITDEIWSLHIEPQDVPYFFIYVFANDQLRLDRRYKRDKDRYIDSSYIKKDFTLKMIDFWKFFAPQVYSLADIGIETSNLPRNVEVYTFRNRVLNPNIKTLQPRS